MSAVLAFIGKVLLVILCILLFFILLVGLVLFVPIRYKTYMEKQEDLEVKLKISWLLSIIHFSFIYKDNEVYYKIRLFGIDLVKAANLFKRKKKKDNKKNESIEHKEGYKETLDSKITYEKSLDDKVVDDRNKNSIEALQKDKENEGFSEKKKGIGYKLKEIAEFIRKCINTLKEAKEKVSDLKNKAADIKNKVFIIKEFIFSEYVKGIICIVRGNVLKLFRKIKPRKLKSDIVFGLGDPCSTGEVLGGIAVFMAVTGIIVNVTPDFERQILKGRLEAAGKIRIFALIRIALGIIMSKEWKSFYKEAMRIKEEL